MNYVYSQQAIHEAGGFNQEVFNVQCVRNAFYLIFSKNYCIYIVKMYMYTTKQHVRQVYKNQ